MHHPLVNHPSKNPYICSGTGNSNDSNCFMNHLLFFVKDMKNTFIKYLSPHVTLSSVG